MATPHNSAEIGDIAERVLLPGDPLRAKFIAENFLSDVKKYNEIRNVYGFTGKYKNIPVTVQATGMGIPSFSIYVHELIHVYGAKKLIRVGTCGGMHEKLKLRDVVIAQGTSTDSSIVRQVFGGAISFSLLADYELLSKAVENAKKLNIPVKVGNVFCTDYFYNDYCRENGIFSSNGLTLDQKMIQHGILAVEMESAALYMLAAAANVQGLALFTVSDHLGRGEESPAEEREKDFNEMIKIALETVIE
ncbi:MAG: purine-nucleoside phosphorylase [Selenomonadaceae bacterium]|nr:purine-nucleoside phosphorylase [Selenomonadaceae bacterium]